MTKVAVILAGCGYLDGTEIREAVITLLALDRKGADVSIFAPDKEQMHVVNHYTGDIEKDETRNVLVEAARIARGKISPLHACNPDNMDAMVLPGGFGMAKNLSDLATKGADVTVLPECKTVLTEFFKAKKPIGAICISPAILAAALSDIANITVTLGKDDDKLIQSIGGTHQECATDKCVIDDEHNIISCAAYMQEAALSDVASGIEAVIEEVMNRA